MLEKTINYSIIIPTHNSSNSLEVLLKSIPRRSDTEVIIIDDYSDKDELKAVQEMIHKYSYINIKLLINEGLNSAGAARNMGIEIARGRRLIFADSDDVFSKQIDDIFERSKNFLIDLVFFQVGSNISSVRTDVINRLIKTGDLNSLRYLHVVPWGKIISKELVDRHSIRFSEVIVGNDELFSAKVGSYATSIEIDYKEGYLSIERNGSLTTQKHDVQLQNIRMTETLKKYRFLSNRLSRGEMNRAGLTTYHSVKKAMNIGGLRYGMVWYIKLRRSGGTLNLPRIIYAKTKRFFVK